MTMFMMMIIIIRSLLFVPYFSSVRTYLLRCMLYFQTFEALKNILIFVKLATLLPKVDVL